MALNAKQLDNSIRAELPATGKGTWRDPEFPGLELRGNRKGATWYVRHRVDRKRVRDRLEGRWPAITPAAAREAARMLLSEVAVQAAAGVDLVARRAETKRKARAGTFGEVLAKYEREHLVNLKSGTEYSRRIRNVFGHLAARPLLGTGLDEILDAAEDRRQTSATSADAAMRYLKSFYSWASDKRIAPNILADVKVAQTRRRTHRILPEDLGTIIVALEADPSTVALCAHTAFALAGRDGEVARMRIDELDLAGRVWTCPDTKNGLTDRVPLSDYATALIETAMARRSDGGPFVFAGNTGRPVSGWSKLKSRIDAATGIEGWRWHDIRRTFTWAVAEGDVPKDVADRCLNHAARGRTTLDAIYHQHDRFRERKAAFDIWGDTLARYRATAMAENVVPLGRPA